MKTMKAISLSAYGDFEALCALGASVRGYRLGRNFTQQHVASLAGISLPTYRKIERGDGTIEMRHFARVVAIFGQVERLRDVIPPVAVAIDRKSLELSQRQRARRGLKHKTP